MTTKSSRTLTAEKAAVRAALPTSNDPRWKPLNRSTHFACKHLNKVAAYIFIYNFRIYINELKTHKLTKDAQTICIQ